MAGKIMVLVVDDEQVIRQCCERTAFPTEFDLRAVHSPEEGLRLIKEDAGFKIVLTDLKMPGMDGMEFIRQARQLAPDVRLVLISGFATDEVREQARDMGVDFLAKPFGPKELLDILWKEED
ncbi:MAG: response regulator [Thermodesulfovibrionales bacterium]|nr:response regulator [Thermodesulfovibrionales bacterium]